MNGVVCEREEVVQYQASIDNSSLRLLYESKYVISHSNSYRAQGHHLWTKVLSAAASLLASFPLALALSFSATSANLASSSFLELLSYLSRRNWIADIDQKIDENTADTDLRISADLLIIRYGKDLQPKHCFCPDFTDRIVFEQYGSNDQIH